MIFLKCSLRILAILISFVAALLPKAESCSVFHISGESSVVAKNLDWVSGQGRIFVNKRGIEKRAILIDTSRPLRWISKYASLTVTGNGAEFPWEGINESGLSINSLILGTTVVPTASEILPSVDHVQWIQYILDTSATLTEAIQNAKQVRISSGALLHYFVCEVSGTCATIEYIDGALKVYEGSGLPVKALTNTAYEKALSYFDSISDLPDEVILYKKWSTTSLSRFARATVWSKKYFTKTTEALAHGFHGLNNLAQFIPATAKFPAWKTYWNLVFDLKSKTVYWRTIDSPSVKSVSLQLFPNHCSTKTQILDLNVDGEGSMESKFETLTEETNNRAVDAWVKSLPPTFDVSENAIALIKKYPTTTTCRE